MKLFRIQDENDNGLYRINDGSGRNGYFMLLPADFHAGNEGNRQHPLPYEDSLLVSNRRKREALVGLSDCTGELRYAFNSIEQLRRWMYKDEWLECCDAIGLYVAVYEVPEDQVIVGHTQCCFNRLHAKRIKMLRCNELENYHE